MSNFYYLKDEARLEVYNYIHNNIRNSPKKKDGNFDEFTNEFINNDVDALRHAYVSGVYTLEYSEQVADILGRLNELFTPDSGNNRAGEENMDLWNNAIGRKYGKTSKSRQELIKALHSALKSGELITDPNDLRKYRGAKSISRKPESLVIVIQESESGENTLFFDLSAKKVLTKAEFILAIKAGKYPNYSYRIVDGREIPVSKKDRYNFNNLG